MRGRGEMQPEGGRVLGGRLVCLVRPNSTRPLCSGPRKSHLSPSDAQRLAQRHGSLRKRAGTSVERTRTRASSPRRVGSLVQCLVERQARC